MNQEKIAYWLEKNLLSVEKPGRYVGGEYNQVIKDWDDVSMRIALVFPDIYDLGISNLGLAILYDEINARTDSLAERSYSPWIDMEERIRKDGIPIFSVESKRALSEFDIIAFTIPYETLYTNVLNVLDMAQIPLKSSDRNEKHPFILAGGHATFNPEPMAEFIDAFAIGEGEEIIHDIIDIHKQWKETGNERKELLQTLAGVQGIYIPAFYHPTYQADGKFSSISSIDSHAPEKILKRIVPVLPPPPTKFIVPSIDTVHNRISVEIMRGCSRGCRFCHAGMINRPVRERPVPEILNAIEDSLAATGFEEIALLSLSSSDYTQLSDLISQISNKFREQQLRISLPSLRIDTFSVEIMEKLKDSRPGGFTLAPEAATDRMRKTINKPISIEQLLITAREVYERGWPTLKLYFMIGHPNETLEDVQAIADLCKTIRDIGFKAIGRRAKLHAGISTFVPKPHTPFQWTACDTMDNVVMKQDLLRRELRGPGLKLNWTDPKETRLESVLSRGDRRLSRVILSAWKMGAKFDAWQDKTRHEVWEKAFSENDLDPAFYSHRLRALDEHFPWEHIQTGVRKEFLLKEYLASLEAETREDCSSQCHACGILAAFSELRKGNPGEIWKCPDIVTRVN